MQTKKIKVDSLGHGMEPALDAAENFARQMGLDERLSRRLRLLSEETLSMVRAIVADFEADFWLESMPGGCRLHLEAETRMNYLKKKDLISVSTSKKNAASVGIMGKIRDIIEDSCYGFSSVGYTSAGMGDITGAMPGAYLWTLEKYRDDVEAQADEDPAMEEALDELEHSIVANIADDIRVAVKGNRVEMVIDKSWEKQ